MNDCGRSGHDLFRGRLYLASLSKFGNLPFRRLCIRYGCDATVSEMASAENIVRGIGWEFVLMRRHPDEAVFGIQIVGRDAGKMAEAAARAEELGADFVDLNYACPIRTIVKRGMGASLMEKGGKVGRITAAVRNMVTVPVSVKLRAGWYPARPTAVKIARLAVDAGADAVFLHPRSREQHYCKAADWTLVREVVEAVEVPVIGGGDLFHWDTVEEQQKQSGCASVMLARGALTKPWLFREIRKRQLLDPSSAERFSMLVQYRNLCLNHFGSDETGQNRTRLFLELQLQFLARYAPTGKLEIRQELQQRFDPPTPRDELEALMLRQDAEGRAELAARVMAAETGDLTEAE